MRRAILVRLGMALAIAGALWLSWDTSCFEHHNNLSAQCRD